MARAKKGGIVVPPPALDPKTLRWRSAEKGELPLRGLPWFAENGGSFSRLPKRAEKKVRPDVWFLAQQPAGVCAAFRSDTDQMAVRITLPDPDAMPHMPFTGSNSVTLYAAEDGEPLRWWATAVPPSGRPEAAFERELFQGAPRRMRDYRLYFPLYKEVKHLSLGFPKGAKVLGATPPRVQKPIVFYGTSITQGGCAATAATDGVNLLSRKFDAEVVNLGFSGNGQGEPELARLISEIDASLYVLDYAANVAWLGDKLQETLPVFVKILQKRRPGTPILLVTPMMFGSLNSQPHWRRPYHKARDYILWFYAEQRRRGNENLHLADGFGLVPYGADPAFVDGIHPTDTGFALWAERIAPHIAYILRRE